MAYAIPPGLEYLAQVDQVLVKQIKELFEIFTGCEMNNKYQLKNNMGQDFLMARESTDCMTRYCCQAARCFEMGLYDNQEQEVLHLSRPLRCAGCCCPCCLQTLTVSSSSGTVMGTIEQEWSICTPLAGKFSVKNVAGDVVLLIQGPVCAISCGDDVDFQVLSADGSVQVGKITKQWAGLCAEAITDADNFSVTFPMDMEVRTKALLLGALFLIDFIYFERSNN